MPRLLRSLGCALLVVLLDLVSLHSAPSALNPPSNETMLDCAWIIRLWEAPAEKRFELVRRAHEKSPDDLHAKAQYAKFLVLGAKLNGPAGRAGEGVALAQACAEQGNSVGKYALGLAKLEGLGTEKDVAYAESLLRASAQAGYLEAMITLSGLYIRPNTTDAELAEAETWLRLAAQRGSPVALYNLATFLEKPRPGHAMPVDKVGALLLEASIHGSGAAGKSLKEAGKDNNSPPALRRAAALQVVYFAANGYDGVFPATVKRTATELEALYPQDPDVLLALGRLYRSGEYQMRDFKRAYGLFEKAAALGADDALAERAHMQAEGVGTAADPAAALATWRELEKKGNARALALLGYYSYWGALKADGLPKDPKAAYGYSRLAAAGGDFDGQKNVTFCFAHGIGTERDYRLAAVYSHAAAFRGNVKARKEFPKYLAEAFD